MYPSPPTGRVPNIRSNISTRCVKTVLEVYSGGLIMCGEVGCVLLSVVVKFVSLYVSASI